MSLDVSGKLGEAHQDLKVGEVVYEPDGNIPPDFAVAQTIGVEVRRLNQNFENSDGSTEGLEELSIPIWHRVKKLLPSLGPSIAGECWYVGLDFRRPLGAWKPIRTELQRQLLSFKTQEPRTRVSLQITPNLEIDLFRAGKDHGNFFVLGASSDDDSGGWVMGELEKNLRLCIAEKERKIAPYRAHYQRWWLVLADHIDYGMDPEDRSDFQSTVMPRIPHSFDRVVLIDPRDFRRRLEV